MMKMDSQALVKLGQSFPESLGNFHLDDHHVSEWEDSGLPGVRHKARKETGKWINPINNADIQYQKHEDCKHSDLGKEQTRTEVIQGQAPDSTFQIIRSRTQFHEGGNNNFSTRVQSSSNSYQMSSSGGVRSTSKSTSNRTTTKTVTVGVGRSEDFEHLGLSFQPLDTSKQRERINMSRSGTMGVRRPPTRRHTPVTPAPLMSTSPDDSEVEIKDEIIVDSDDNLRSSPELEMHHTRKESNQTGLSIVGVKDFSPKIRVGFPVEIQLELQTKFNRGSSNIMRNGDVSDDQQGLKSHQSIERNDHVRQSEDTSQASPFLFENQSREERTPYEFVNPRVGFGGHANNTHVHTSNKYLKDFSYSDRFDKIRTNNDAKHVPDNSVIDKSWEFDSTNNSHLNDRHESYVSKKINSKYLDTLVDDITTIPIHLEKTAPIKTIVNLHTSDGEYEPETFKYLGNDNYMVTPSQYRFYGTPNKSPLDQEPNNETETYTSYKKTPTLLQPSLERSRRLLQMLDETHTVLPKFSLSSQSSKIVKEKEEEEEGGWEAQRQLSFLNDSLSRILEGGSSRVNSSDNNLFIKSGPNNNLIESDTLIYTSPPLVKNISSRQEETDYNGNIQNKFGQVSQTWISSSDHKPSQKVRDNDVTTSISTTHDHFKRGQKKVEFCKTEVHFTPDSGKFHIVETDENKPSTTHLFRKKKRDRTNTASSKLKEESISTLNENNVSNNKLSKLLLLANDSTPNQSHGPNKDFSIQSESQFIDKKQKATESIKSSYGLQTDSSNSSSQYSSGGGHENSKENVDSCSLSRILDVTHSGSSSSSNNNNNTNNSSFNADQHQHHYHHPPSRTILSEYEDMKIQRYLNHLKSPSQPSSLNPSNDDFRNKDDHSNNITHRFNNLLYENGSFVPLATRRSLIEMNNNNNANQALSLSDSDMNKGSESNSYSYNSSDSFGNPRPLVRLARLEAKVATARSDPQITSVQLRYEFENNNEPTSLPSQYSLNYKTEQDRTTSEYNKQGLLSLEHKSLDFNKQPENYNYNHQSSKSGRFSDLIKRSYYKNPILDLNVSPREQAGFQPHKEPSMTTSTISSVSHNNKGASKSIVTIGDYEYSRIPPADKSPEPILSMDHTWKGPAANNNNFSESGQKFSNLLRHSEPEWVSKARNREARVTDWDLVGKQNNNLYSTPSQPEQPPWIDDIIRKPILSTDKNLPKISVVYPWQKSKGKDDGKSPDLPSFEGESHIVSVPTNQALHHTTSEEKRKNERGPKSLPNLPERIGKNSLDPEPKLTGGGKVSKSKRSLPEPPSSSPSLFEKGQKSTPTTTTRDVRKQKPTIKPDNKNYRNNNNPINKTIDNSSLLQRDKGVTSGSNRVLKKVDSSSAASPSSSHTPIHRHPLVKVSKLPTRRNNIPSSSKGTERQKVGGEGNSDRLKITTTPRSKENQTVADESKKKQPGTGPSKGDYSSKPSPDKNCKRETAGRKK